LALSRALSRPLRLASGDNFEKRPLNLLKTRFRRRAPRVNHDVPAGRQICSMQSKGLAKPALDLVAHHRSAQRPRGCNTKPWTGIRPGSRQAERREQRTGDAKTLVINGSKIGGSQNPRGLRKFE